MAPHAPACCYGLVSHLNSLSLAAGDALRRRNFVLLATAATALMAASGTWLFSASTSLLSLRAIGFAVSGFAFVALVLGRHGWSRAAGWFLFALALLAAGESLAALYLGAALPAALTLLPPFAPRTTLPLAGLWALIGLALIAMGRSRGSDRRTIALGMVGAIAVALPVAGVIGYVFASVSDTPNELLGVTLGATPGYLAVGSGILAFAWYETALEQRRGTLWPAFLVMVGVLGATLLLWQALRAQADEHIHSIVAAQSSSVKNELDARMQSRVLALARMGRRWEYGGRPTADRWQHEARLYLDHFPGFTALRWVDADYRPRWTVIPPGRPGATRVHPDDIAHERAALIAARDFDSVRITPFVRLGAETRGFAVVVPLRQRTAFDGFLIGYVRADELLYDVLPNRVSPGFDLAIAQDGDTVYTRGNNNTDPRWRQEERLDLYGTAWRIYVAPSAATLARERSPLPTMVLLAGLLTSALLVWVVYLAQKSNFRRRQIEAVNANLSLEMRERQRTAEHLRNERGFLAAMLDNIGDGIIACDRDGEISLFNPAACELHGVDAAPRGSLAQWARDFYWSDAAGEQRLDAAAMPLARAWAGERMQGEEFQIRPAQGEPRFVRVGGQAIVDADGAKLGAVIVVRDVTENRRARRELARKNAYVELLHAVAVAANEATTVESAAQAAVERIGQILDWAAGRLWLCDAASEERPPLRRTGVSYIAERFDMLRAALAGDGAIDTDLPARVMATGEPTCDLDNGANEAGHAPLPEALAAGGIRAAYAFPIHLRDRVVGVLEFFGVQPDPLDAALIEALSQVGNQLGRVVERTRAEAALRESELRFRSVAESAKDAIVTADRNGVVISCNRAAAALFRYDANELCGQPFSAIVAPQFHDAYQRRLTRLRGEGAGLSLGQTIEMVGRRKDASEFPVEISLASWTVDERMFYTGILRDISERRKTEQAIKALNEDLERRVDERTAQLKATNRELAGEINERMRAERAARRYARQQAAVAKLGHQALLSVDPQELMRQAVGTVMQTLGVEFCSVFELDSDHGEFLLRAGDGWQPHLVGALRVPAGVELQLGFTLHAGGPVISEDVAREARFTVPQFLHEHRVTSDVSVVIPGAAQPYGVLSAHTRAQRTFVDDDVHFLETVANVLATAMSRRALEQERARLLREEQAARAEAEDAHREAEAAREQAIGILESITDAFFTLDDAWRFTYVNRMAEQLFKRKRADLIDRSFWHVFPEAVDSNWQHELARVRADRVSIGFEATYPALGGWYEVNAYPGTDAGVSVYFRDITERKRNQEALRQSELRLRLMFEGVTDYAIFMLDPDGHVVNWNVGAERITGFEPDAIIGRSADCLYPSERRGLFTRELALARGEGRFEEEAWRLREDGSRFWANVVTTRIDDADGNLIGFSTIHRDLTERKRAEESLAAEKERLAVTLYSIADGVITTDTHGTIVLMNKVAEELTGWTHTAAHGKPLASVLHVLHEKSRIPFVNPIAMVLREGGAAGMTGILQARNGTERLIAQTGAPIRDRDANVIGAVLVIRDVTEKARLEQELQKSRNLESIGLLAGGIAHDFNNILTAILGNIALAKMYAKAGDPIYESLAEAEKAFGRARDLTQQLLTFSKGGAPIKTTASIAELLRDTTTFVLRGSNVRYEFKIAPDLWSARFDTGQISQVINNLVINAKQAMPNGGTVRIAAHNVELAGNEKELAPGRYICITVDDEGIGIPREHLQRIFDPYFTTKQKGSGLGLATSYSIVKRHEGQIEVESKPGFGARFSVYLPASSETAPRSTESPSAPQLGEGRVLLMDDEETILRVGSALLRRLGYEVTVARNGDEVLHLYRQALAEGRRFDAVVMDLTIPGGMGGKECIVRLHALDPEVRAIVSSGYSNDPVMAEPAKHGFRAVVTKPYQLKELSNTLYAVISA